MLSSKSARTNATGPASHRHSARRATSQLTGPRIECVPALSLSIVGSLKLRAARRQVDVRAWPVEVPTDPQRCGRARDAANDARRQVRSASRPRACRRLKSGVEFRDFFAARQDLHGRAHTARMRSARRRHCTHAVRLLPAPPPRFGVALVILRRRIDLRGFASHNSAVAERLRAAGGHRESPRDPSNSTRPRR